MIRSAAAWYVPMPTKGSGGFRTLLQDAECLELHGMDSDFYFIPNENLSITVREIEEQIIEWFGYRPHGLYYAPDLVKPYDLIIATAWDTAQLVAQQNCDNKAYFIQDYEPWFFPMGSERLLAEASYQLGLTPITLGRWLANTISNLGAQQAHPTDFGADSKVYRCSLSKRERAICAIYQPEKPRRMSKVLLAALDLIHELDPSIAIYLYGSDTDPLPQYDNVYALGVITPKACNELYQKCLLGISLSSSNPSRIPFEMMAAGLPVVELDRENNAYDMPDSAVTLAAPSPAGIAGTVLQIVQDSSRLHSMSQEGKAFMKKRDLAAEGHQFYRACIDILEHRTTSYKRFFKINYADYPLESSKASWLYMEKTQRKYERIRLSVQPLAVYHHSLFMKIQFTSMDPENATIACWNDDNQADLVWARAEKKGRGLFICRCVQPSFSEYSDMYHFHVYVTRQGSKTQQCALSFNQSIIAIEKNCHNKNVSHSMQISENDYCCDLSSSSETIAL